MKIGFTIGKFPPLHKGHQLVIEKGLHEMDQFYIILYETNVTPIPLETRANWIKTLYPEATLIYATNPPNRYGLDEESVKIQTNYLKTLLAGIPVTHFYNSEPYGKFVARDLKVKDVQVDSNRKLYPIAATSIRQNLDAHQNDMEKIVYHDLKKF